MKSKLLPVIVLGLVLAGAAAARADGDIYTGGPWGTQITSLPYEIKTGGSYYLGANLSYAGTGITITNDHVTLDLMGFRLSGSGSGNGIDINASTNVEIRNGTVTGFFNGIRGADGGLAHRIINVRAVGNTRGIYLPGTGHLVTGCESTATLDYSAILIGSAGRVSGCTTRPTAGNGIRNLRGVTSGNVVIGGGNTGTGIYAYDQGSVVRGNKVKGCATGITCGAGAAIIGNTVTITNGTTGISLFDITSNMLDQNTVLGAGISYSPSNFSNAAKRNNYYLP